MTGLLARFIVATSDDRVEIGIDPLDLGDEFLHELRRRHLAALDHRREFDCRKREERMRLDVNLDRTTYEFNKI
jgi:hypothetical protein